MNGADLVCSVLRRLDVQCVFGLPGTQNVRLYEAMRASGLRRVVSADEGSAAFMAAGYARASGRVGVLTTIPGPGFVYALPGIVEARHDSVPLLWITLRQADLGRAFQLQRIDQAEMAAPAVKQCLHIGSGDALVTTLAAAHELARAGEPGPVLVEIDAALLDTNAADSTVARSRPATPRVEALAARLAESRHPVLYVGQGAQDGSEAVRALARRLRAPVLCTSSGRGVLPDTDELAFTKDFSTGVGLVVPDLIERADLVLTLGCKFTHNGSGGRRAVVARGEARSRRRFARGAVGELPGFAGRRRPRRGRAFGSGERLAAGVAVALRGPAVPSAPGSRRRVPFRFRWSRRCPTCTAARSARSSMRLPRLRASVASTLPTRDCTRP